MSIRYVIHPVGMPNFFFAGKKLGFSFDTTNAYYYVSEEVAKMASAIIQADMRAHFPNCLAITYGPVNADV